jgi:hypothetical protein
VTVHDLISRLPDPEALRARCRAFAVLDVCFAGFMSTYSFQPGWAPGVDLASMDNGGGDLFRVVFGPAGVFLYGFDHESEATPWRDDGREHWPGLLDGLPDSLAGWTREPAFQFMDFFDATVCAWREAADDAWRCGPVEFDGIVADPDGAEYLFQEVADGSAEVFAAYAAQNYERDVDVEAVRAILGGAVLTPEIVAALNPAAVPFATVAKAAAAMGYPVVAETTTGTGAETGTESEAAAETTVEEPA